MCACVKFYPIRVGEKQCGVLLAVNNARRSDMFTNISTMRSIRIAIAGKDMRTGFQALCVCVCVCFQRLVSSFSFQTIAGG